MDVSEGDTETNQVKRVCGPALLNSFAKTAVAAWFGSHAQALVIKSDRSFVELDKSSIPTWDY